jgi:predicted DNA-binding transcriptional regulator AlpA
MAAPHILRALDPTWRRSSRLRRKSRQRSGVLAHLTVMAIENDRDTSSRAANLSLTDGVLSLSELCVQLQVSAQTIYDLRSQVRGPRGFRVGRQLPFRVSEIESWLTRMGARTTDATRCGAGNGAATDSGRRLRLDHGTPPRRSRDRRDTDA